MSTLSYGIINNIFHAYLALVIFLFTNVLLWINYTLCGMTVGISFSWRLFSFISISMTASLGSFPSGLFIFLLKFSVLRRNVAIIVVPDSPWIVIFCTFIYSFLLFSRVMFSIASFFRLRAFSNHMTFLSTIKAFIFVTLVSIRLEFLSWWRRLLPPIAPTFFRSSPSVTSSAHSLRLTFFH